jgi:hypothetical protein
MSSIPRSYDLIGKLSFFILIPKLFMRADYDPVRLDRFVDFMLGSMLLPPLDATDICFREALQFLPSSALVLVTLLLYSWSKLVLIKSK